MLKKNLLKGIVMLGLVTISVGSLHANYIDDAAELIVNEELTERDLAKDFSNKEIEKIKEKVKHLRLKNLRDQKRAEEEKAKRLEEPRRKEPSVPILVDDLEKKVNNRFSKLERRVSSLEKNKNKATTQSSKSNKAEIKKISRKEAIDLIIKGKMGDGQERIEKLKKLGFVNSEIKEIQKEVTKIINEEIKTDLSN